MALAILGYSRAVGLNWVIEKENRHKELQSIMGMRILSYWVGWLTYFFLNGILVSVLMLIIFAITINVSSFKFAEGFSFYHLIIIYFFFMTNVTGFVLVVSILFSKAKTAAQVLLLCNLGDCIYPAADQFPLLPKIRRFC